MKKYLIASLILAATTVPSLAAAQHFVVEDTEKYCSVIDAAPSKDPESARAAAGLRLSCPGRDGVEEPELQGAAGLRPMDSIPPLCGEARRRLV
jgi:hypothetical protein